MVKATLDAEYSVIGCLLVDPSIAGELLSRTREEDFTIPELRTVYKAAARLFQAGRPVDAVTIRGVCGAEYNDLLMQCMDVTPTSFGWRTFLTAREALDAGLVDEILGETGQANPMNVWNAAGGAPDIEKLRAAYREAQQGKPPMDNVSNLNTKQARARAIALAEAELY